MNVIVCVDDEGGMMFNSRRQSKDRELIKRVYEITADNRLWINHYSVPLFREEDNIIVDDMFLQKAAYGDYCFVENERIPESSIERLIVYKWNRRYPSDFKLNIRLEDWSLSSSYEFAGYSHEKITEEVYTR